MDTCERARSASGGGNTLVADTNLRTTKSVGGSVSSTVSSGAVSDLADVCQFSEYVVQDRDTVTSVAAKFDLTPNELKMFNPRVLQGGRQVFIHLSVQLASYLYLY